MNALAPSLPDVTDHLAGFLKAAGDPLRLQVLQVLGQNSFGVPVLGDQLLLGIMLFGVPGKKGAALLGTPNSMMPSRS